MDFTYLVESVNFSNYSSDLTVDDAIMLFAQYRRQLTFEVPDNLYLVKDKILFTDIDDLRVLIICLYLWRNRADYDRVNYMDGRHMYFPCDLKMLYYNMSIDNMLTDSLVHNIILKFNLPSKPFEFLEKYKLHNALTANPEVSDDPKIKNDILTALYLNAYNSKKYPIQLDDNISIEDIHEVSNKTSCPINRSIVMTFKRKSRNIIKYDSYVKYYNKRMYQNN